MLSDAVANRRPAAHEERPAGPQHHRRGEQELQPHRDLRRDIAVKVQPWKMRAHFQDHNRHRQRGADPEAARHVDQFGARAGFGADAAWAPAPCRRSGRSRVRPAGLRDASGRYRSCLPASASAPAASVRAAFVLCRITLRVGDEFACGSPRSRNNRFAPDTRRGVAWHPRRQSCRRPRSFTRCGGRAGLVVRPASALTLSLRRRDNAAGRR